MDQWNTPQYQPYQPQPPRRPEKPKRHRLRRVVLIGLGSLAGLIVIAAVAAPHDHAGQSAVGTPASSSAAPASSSAAAPASTPAHKAHTVATFSGSGDLNTARFTVGDTWKLVYRFNCSTFGAAGNFAVLEDGSGGPGGLSVNDLSKGRSGSSWAYNDSGTHYLEILSECSWKVRVVDES